MPEEIAKRLPKDKRTLAANERYLGEDWCKDGPNCITRTLQIVKDGLQAVIDGKGSDADKATAKCIKDRLDAMKGYYPGDFKNDLRKLAEDY